MQFDVSVAMTWLLYLALFPIAFFWLRRAWRIFVRGNYAEVALRGGVPPDNPRKFAPYTGGLNLICGLIVVTVIVGVAIGHFQYETWTAIAGLTLWGKFIADFIIGRHAHPIWGQKKP